MPMMLKTAPWSGLLSLALLVAMVTGSSVDECLQGSNCRLPECFCPTSSHPMPARLRPMILYFGFDDAVNSQVAQYYRELFTPKRQNPNGCPISMSLYVSHPFTDYSLVRDLYQAGHEIGVHSTNITPVTTAEQLQREASEQRDNIVRLGGVRYEDVVGWRSPDLVTAGDRQPDVLKDLGFLYDISLTYARRHLGDSKVWPATLDFGWPYRCNIPPCPLKNSSHPGFWEVPVNSLIDYKNEFSCVYVDGCFNTPKTEEEALEYLENNFNDFYTNGKVPFGLNMRPTWFLNKDFLQAMDTFLDKVLRLPDVYIVSVTKMMDWMKTPKNLAEINQLKSWNCTRQA